MKKSICLPFFLVLATHALPTFLAAAESINNENPDLYCLQLVQPRIKGFVRDNGKVWATLDNGEKILYSGKYAPANDTPDNDCINNDSLDVDLAKSMAQIYPLEPDRPDTSPGFAPGRRRPYSLWHALYGNSAKAVKSVTVPVRFLGKNIYLAPDAAAAFARAAPELELLASKNPAIKKLLKPEGGFYWRKIAGENVLSPHSFGLAIDFAANISPYWRWNKLRPHPAQRSYPTEIVKIMEDHGFIWGGKWHEYDIMHFEYRPELICKARLLKGGINLLPDSAP